MKDREERMKEKRFAFFSALALILLGLSGAEAQQAPRIPRIGILIPESQPSESQSVEGLREGLKELGYQEGKNILVETRNAKGDRTALKPAAIDLVNQKISLIFTTGTRATQAAKAATSEIPIVFRHPADPVALGFVKSMKRPGGNLTGVAALSLQMTPKRFEILKEIFPKVRRVLILFDSNNRFSHENFTFAQKAAAKLGLQVADYPVKSAEELKSSISSIQKTEGDALFHLPDDLVEGQTNFIFETMRKKGLPTMSYEEIWVTKGALAGYGPNYFQMGRQAARLIDRILKGQKPQDLPVEQANKFDLVINLRTANVIGVPIPPEVLKKADKVIR
ncbi:MAG: ABC transporter substrate-binding protein [Deltaproteobacteria bacterium]|nr:ABC transporter substrate-binding protein [Deltaproteobacteria bacterium]